MSTHTFQQDRRHPGYCRVEGCELPLSTEVHNTVERLCPGVMDECGDELEPDQKLCRGCQREEDEMYHRRQLDAEGHYDLLDYPHLVDRD